MMPAWSEMSTWGIYREYHCPSMVSVWGVDVHWECPYGILTTIWDAYTLGELDISDSVP